MYKALMDFKDIKSGKEYKAGDTVDVGGASASKIAFMLKANNSRGALIEEVEEPKAGKKEVLEETEEAAKEIDEPQGV